MLIWIWGNPLPSSKVEAWTLQGHHVVHREFQDPFMDLIYFQSVTKNISEESSKANAEQSSRSYSPDLVLVTDWEDRPAQSLRQEALGSLSSTTDQTPVSTIVQTKVLFHAVGHPLPSDGPAGWAAWNAWPDSLESNCWEVAIPDRYDSDSLRLEWQSLAAELQCELVFCPNRGGMVTPRILACIINEAYLTRDQGIATAEDIDLGMRYGTNYPRGPFDWCRRIGAHRIVQALDAWATEQPGQDAYLVAGGLRREAMNY